MIGGFHQRAVRDAQILRKFAWQVAAEASAILRGADLAESCSWSRKSGSRWTIGLRINSYTPSFNSLESCQLSSSSNERAPTGGANASVMPHGHGDAGHEPMAKTRRISRGIAVDVQSGRWSIQEIALSASFEVRNCCEPANPRTREPEPEHQ